MVSALGDLLQALKKTHPTNKYMGILCDKFFIVFIIKKRGLFKFVTDIVKTQK